MRAESLCMTGLGLDVSLFLGGRLSSKIQGRGDSHPPWGAGAPPPKHPSLRWGPCHGEGLRPLFGSHEQKVTPPPSDKACAEGVHGPRRGTARLQGPRGAPCSPKGLCPGPCPHAPIGPFPPRTTRTRVEAARPRRPEPLPRSSPPVFRSPG